MRDPIRQTISHGMVPTTAAISRYVETGHIGHHHVHGDGTDNRRPPATNQHGAAPLEAHVQAIGITSRNDGDPCGCRRLELDAVADPFTGAHAFDGDHTAAQRHHGSERNGGGKRRRDQAIEQQARPDAVVPDARIAEQRGTVARVSIPWPPAERRNILERVFEPCPLLREQRRSGIVRRGEVRVYRVEFEPLAGQQLRQGTTQVVVAKPQSVHAGIDLEVIANRLAVLRGGLVYCPGSAGRRDRRRQAAIEQAVQVADAQGAEDQDFRLNPGRAQRRPFFDIGAGEQIGTHRFEGARHLHGTVTVRVRLDHRNRPRRGVGALVRQVVDDSTKVVFERAEIDARDGRTDHAWAPRSSCRRGSRTG
jgi:hypothetical protein